MSKEAPGVQSAGGRVSVTLPPLSSSRPAPGTTAAMETTAGIQSGPSIHRSTRGFSRKLQDRMNQQRQHCTGGGDGVRVVRTGSKFEPRNWRQLSEKQLQKLPLVQRSRYLAYEPVPKDLQERKGECVRRIRDRKTQEYEQQRHQPSLSEVIEAERNSELVGELKASEARRRLRDMRAGYEQYKLEELKQLIASQPSSIEAVRLKTFVPPSPHTWAAPDLLSKRDRIRCEVLLEDEQGLTTNRTA